MILWVTTLNVLAGDTLQVEQEQPKEKLGWLRRVIRGFSYVDENYVEPQHYNWSVMLQATHTYDYYRLSTTGPEGQSVLLAPKPTVKAGPYFGWRWVFLGYTFDLKNFDVGYNSMKQEFDFSIYSAQIGADLYYRRTGSDYQIRDISMGKKQDMSKMMRVPFDGLSVGITGINL